MSAERLVRWVPVEAGSWDVCQGMALERQSQGTLVYTSVSPKVANSNRSISRERQSDFSPRSGGKIKSFLKFLPEV